MRKDAEENYSEAVSYILPVSGLKDCLKGVVISVKI